MRKLARFLYELLIAPSATVDRPEIQRRVTLLTCLNLIYVAAVLIFFILSIVGPYKEIFELFYLLLLIDLFFHVVSYLLIRSRFYEIGGTLFCGTMFIGVVASIAVQPILRVVVSVLPFFVMPAMFATFALSFRWNVVVFVLCVAGTLLSAAWAGYFFNVVAASIIVFNLTALVTLLTGSFLKQLDTRQLAQERLQVFHSARMSTLGEMVGGVAHEVNNPITVIHLRATQALRLLKQPSLDIDRLTEFLESIQKTTTHIEKVVKGLRSFSRTGGSDPFEEVEVATIIDESLSLFGEQMRNEHIDVRLLPYDKTLKIECRATEIAQILLNLYSNARAALRKCDEKWMEISVEDFGDTIGIAVVDSGKGIPSSVARLIFEPFFTTKKASEGTGIGLSISRSIAKAHQGDLRYDPQSPNTRFILEIRKKLL